MGYEELEEIPDYERPVLEKFEGSDLQPSKQLIKKQLEKDDKKLRTADEPLESVSSTYPSEETSSNEKPSETPKLAKKPTESDTASPSTITDKKIKASKPNEDASSKAKDEPKKILKSKTDEKSLEKSITKKHKKVQKYEPLPEIPDYERPELEKYEETKFDPTKNVKSTEVPDITPEIKLTLGKRVGEHDRHEPGAPESALLPDSDESHKIKLSKPKLPPATSVEEASGSIQAPKRSAPFSVETENVSKNVTIKEDLPIEITITEPEEIIKPSLARKLSRAKNDPMGFIADEDYAMEATDTFPSHVSRPNIDPITNKTDKNDSASVENVAGYHNKEVKKMNIKLLRLLNFYDNYILT